jgi:hypothetical protein
MAGAEIGGDSSVQWVVSADNVRLRPEGPTSDPNPPGGPGWIQRGIDESGFGAENGFVISLEMPRDPGDADTFVDTLSAACAEAQAHRRDVGFVVSFIMPIEEKNTDQIKVEWSIPKLQAKRPDPRKAFERWLRQQCAAMLPKKPKPKKKASKRTQKSAVKKARKRSR